ncbi:MAG: type I-C CRISPR-associated protein Cas5 [Spirochaetes bacterium]|nr:MAG: type I-C CRISPR-associated protein Cas5 [Spirochaetota bacterium]
MSFDDFTEGILEREYFNKIFCLEVWGDYACFTRPEMKVERVSYDVITPSAARAIFEAIFWKPAVEWRIKKIEVLAPIKWISVRRNEVGVVMSDRSDGIFIEDNRQQRAGLLLREVRYRLHAELVYIPPNKRKITPGRTPDFLINEDEKNELRTDENPGKYNGIFERRAIKGQCFNQPYLGCREFSAGFRLVENIEKEQKLKPALNEPSRDLGFMLYDMDFTDTNDPKPAFFRARMDNGVIQIPDWESEEVRR